MPGLGVVADVGKWLVSLVLAMLLAVHFPNTVNSWLELPEAPSSEVLRAQEIKSRNGFRRDFVETENEKQSTYYQACFARLSSRLGVARANLTWVGRHFGHQLPNGLLAPLLI